MFCPTFPTQQAEVAEWNALTLWGELGEMRLCPSLSVCLVLTYLTSSPCPCARFGVNHYSSSSACIGSAIRSSTICST